MEANNPTAATRIAPRSPSDIKSRLDFWLVLSGACLAFFVCVHLLFDGTAAFSPAVTDWIGWLLEVTYIAQIAAPLLILLIIFHFWIAARKMPFGAGELRIFVENASQLHEFDTWLWLVQVITGVIILVGAFFHVYGVMTDLPITVVKSSERLHSGWLAFYALFLPCVIFHTGVGVYRIGVKFGFCGKSAREEYRKIVWGCMIGYLILCICSLTRVWFYT